MQMKLTKRGAGIKLVAELQVEVARAPLGSLFAVLEPCEAECHEVISEIAE